MLANDMRKMFTEKQVGEIAKKVAGGTQLYKHLIVDTAGEYTLVLITPSKDPLDFTTLNSYKKVHDYLLTIVVISFTKDNHLLIYDDSSNEYLSLNCMDGTLETGLMDDWVLASTTDTVTKL